jgi:hypothetical protein
MNSTHPPSLVPLSAPQEMKEKYLICEVWEAVSHTVWCGEGRLIILDEKRIAKEKSKVKWKSKEVMWEKTN